MSLHYNAAVGGSPEIRFRPVPGRVKSYSPPEGFQIPEAHTEYQSDCRRRRIAEEGSTPRQSYDRLRRIFGFMEEVEIGASGRFRLPSILRRRAGIGDAVLVLGAIAWAGVHGLRQGLPAPEPTERDPAAMETDELAALGLERLPQSLDAALATVADLLGLETGWVWLLEEGSDEPHLAAARALPPELRDHGGTQLRPHRLSSAGAGVGRPRDPDGGGASALSRLGLRRPRRPAPRRPCG